METHRKFRIMQHNISRGDLTWWGEIRHDGSRKRINLGTQSQNDATLWMKRMEAMEYLPEEMRVYPEKNIPKKKEPAQMNPADLKKRFRSELSAIHKENVRTMWAYDFRLTHLDSLLEGKSALSKITKSDARAWVTKLSTTDKLAPKTVQEIVKVGSLFWKWAIECEFATENPLLKVPLPKRKKVERPFWTVEEVAKIIAKAPSSCVGAFWSVMAYAGLRHEEAATLTWGRVDLVRKELRIMGKGSKVALVPISARLLAVLQGFKPKEVGSADLCFDNMDKYASNRMRALNTACANLKFEVAGPISIHRFRHSFASNLLRSGVGIKAVQQLMRHEDPRITLDTYGHLLASDLSSAVDVL